MSVADGEPKVGQAGRPTVRRGWPATGARTVLIACSYEDTMILRIISALVLALAATCGYAADKPLTLAETAPSQYTVVRGDTLWDISGKFLKEPWRWPEIWRLNKEQIKNPHRIYPGDVIYLERDANGNPYLSLRKGSQSASQAGLQPQVYSEQMKEAIPPIPPNAIEPFLSTPLIVEDGELENVARVIATQEGRVFLGNGDTAYVTNADPAQQQWYVYRKGSPLYDPEDSKRVLGYEAFYLGTAQQTRPGDPAIFEITTVKEEIGRDSRLLPAHRPNLIDYVPHPPDSQITGRIVSVYGGVGTGGRLSIVSINRGSTDGLEIGHVLSMERDRTVVQRNEYDQKEEFVIPAVHTGLIFVFRVFDRISYALVLQADSPIEIGDVIRTP